MQSSEQTKTAGELSIRHVTDNFALFGFLNSETSILQTAKELIENSLDAVNEASMLMSHHQNRREINLTISEHLNFNYIFMDVADQGCVFIDLILP